MNSTRFDHLLRGFSPPPTRRAVLVGLATVLGLVEARIPGAVVAKAKKGKTNKRLKLNAFGCVDVGKPCRGKNAKCCSGICQGKQPRKGKKDTSTCVAHHVGGCQADEDICQGAPPSQCGTNGHCFRTTGKAGFCGDDDGVDYSPCSGCAKDADCVADLGPGAACVVCAGECVGPDTVCIRAAA